ncbi:MAG: pilus assembly protein [Marinovum algicola]|jgi:Flp pilus assembly protein TadG|uniref:Flp pilus assembly protein TadG n=1 Tax=Marinovum algicola TaxID=42444 RepID=A0A975ZLT7_9RHOB|nr:MULTISPECIES: TadE/TadG family type IV pilus assembly protein [Marinovum]MDD9740178.1 pilus assembly protein [Marinovum sp. SP66]MDD9744255.1 pilus assembly protein [Marinovum sp. PR37]SEI68616.1 Flp pilus assembly protein TadG [Marinovum algicola]SLN23154.1 von Willebrand factor type A domain protein [Marinovum algicola]
MTGFAKGHRAFVRRFWQDDSGNATIVCVYLSLAILLTTGAAIDVMRYESIRTKMQHVLDRAVLAAADLDQEADPSGVAQDYVATAGVAGALTQVTVDEGLNYRTVSATGNTDVETLFMRMAGIDSLNAPAHSVAEEKISKVEISMILDISGSMGSNSKIQNLRAAAKEFVDTVITPTTDAMDQTTVSVVPYNATVNLGPTVSQYFNIEDTHDYSNCVIFNDNEFDTVDITQDQLLKRLAHFDPYSSSETTTEISNPWCPDDDYGQIVVASSDANALKAHIDSLGAGGNTAIDLGMKWGTALLSDAAAPVFDQMRADGHLSESATQRPATFTDTEAMKVVVLMTDGQNTTQYDLKPEFKTEWSDVWIDDRGTTSMSDDRFSVLVDDNTGTSNDTYYWVRYDGWSWDYRYRNYLDGGTSARRMTNAEVYARWGVKGVAKKFWERPERDNFISQSAYSNIYYGYTGIVGATSADTRLSTVCQAARDKGIVVFAIAFEAPTAGQNALKDCASSDSHYFAVEGIEITETFHAIARQINNLRLIQ